MKRGMVLCTFLFFAFQLHAVVIWNGGVAPSVTDDDIDITGDVILSPGGTTVFANLVDVNVNLTGASRHIEATNVPALESQLYLTTSAGRKISFHVDTNTLLMNGSNNNILAPLLIVVSGSGTVEFLIDGGGLVSFNAQDFNPGTQIYVLLAPTGTGPTLAFRNDNALGMASVLVGNESIMSYLSDQSFGSTYEGSILFEGAGSGVTGIISLQIGDDAAVIIDPHLTNQSSGTAITLADINLAQIRGGRALLKVTTSGVASRFNIFNFNTVLSEYRINPFLQGAFTGQRRGFVLGANGEIILNNGTYIDYQAGSLNQCPDIEVIPGFPGVDPQSLIKQRNPSAFIVDGNPVPNAGTATITMTNGESAIVFSSVVANDGTFGPDFPFLTDFALESTPGVGNIVLDVEGKLIVNGANIGDNMKSMFEILSREVVYTGGTLFVESTATLTTFPLISGNLRFNRGAFLINNDMIFNDMSLKHTDINHHVYQKNDTDSEPTYIGGERFTLDGSPRPRIIFDNSRLLVHTDIAFTGLDLYIPQGAECTGNVSKFRFYSNGFVIDDGTGRQFNMGTSVGSTPCDACCGFISRDAYLDIFQDASCAAALHQLVFETSVNNNTINPLITTSIAGQTSIHTFYLGFASNLSIGLQATTTFAQEINPLFLIGGNYFSFETRGGTIDMPSTSNVTGEGGIFVDRNATFGIGSAFRANMATMITKSQNGIVNLPKEQVFFANRIGISDWNLDLSVLTDIIPVNVNISDYTLNWIATKKDYANFTPYEMDPFSLCECMSVTEANIASLPTIFGEVGQFQIQGSRIGDQAQIKIDGGFVRELVFLTTTYSAQAPVGLVVITNDGELGLGTAQRNIDSLNASVVMGVNGVSIIADGNGFVQLNEDILVNNVCSILKGPNFEGNVLTFQSDVPREFRIKDTGILDLRTFSAGDVIQFAGVTRFIMEPGAQIFMAGVTIRFADESQFICEPSHSAPAVFAALPIGPINNALSPFIATDASLPHNQYAPLINVGTGLQNTDSFRARIIGQGILLFTEDSTGFVQKNSFLGIETSTSCDIGVTDITISLQDASQFFIGDLKSPGGTLQVGNVIDADGHSVSFTIALESPDARFVMREQGFLGFGVGIVHKGAVTPNNWIVDNTFNVSSITINQFDGSFIHDRIFDGSDKNASLLAISEDQEIDYTYLLEPIEPLDNPIRTNNIKINAGGNLALIAPSSVSGQYLSPVVLNDDGPVIVDAVGTESARLQTAILSPRSMLSDETVAGYSGLQFFQFLQVKDQTIIGPALGKAAASIGFEESGITYAVIRAGYVDRAKIGRDSIFDIDDALNGEWENRRTLATGSGVVSVQLDTTGTPPGRVLFAQQIPE